MDLTGCSHPDQKKQPCLVGVSSPDSPLPVCSSASPLLPPSACTEASLAVKQLQEQLQDLKVQLETKVRAWGEVSQLLGITAW